MRSGTISFGGGQGHPKNRHLNACDCYLLEATITRDFGVLFEKLRTFYNN